MVDEQNERDLDSPVARELPDFVPVAELDAMERVRRFELRDFCIALARALLQSSYYAPDHPKARQATEEPFQLLSQIVGWYDELTFAIPSPDDESMVVNLEGAFSEPVPLVDVVQGTAGEHFMGKLHSFISRHRLVSISLRTMIRREELDRFVSIFVKSHVDLERVRAMQAPAVDFERGAKLAQELLDNGILQVTVLLRRDILEGRRRLPWRVRVGLSRLQKDLRNVPFYSEATEEELRKAKLRLLRDIIRPLGKPQFLKEFFLNLDLIGQRVDELVDTDLESDLVDVLPAGLVAGVGRQLLAELQRPWWDDEHREDLGPHAEPMMRRQLTLIGTRLAVDDVDLSSKELLKALFRARLVRFSTLPPSLQEELEVDRLVDACRENPVRFIARFDEIDTPAGYREYLRDTLSMFPRLLELRAYIPAELVIQTLARHREEPDKFQGRGQLICNALAEPDDPRVRLLLDALLSGTAEGRFYVTQLLAVFGHGAMPLVIGALERAHSPEVCMSAAGVLAAMGPPGAALAREALVSGQLRARPTRWLIWALGELEERPAARLVAGYVSHPSSGVREETLATLCRLVGRKATPLLLRALDDESPDVVVRAIDLQAELQGRHKAFVLHLVRLVEEPSAGGSKAPPERVRIHAIRTLAGLGNMRLGGRGTLEDVLLGVLGEPKGGVLARLLRRRDDRDTGVRVAVCEAMAAIGTARSHERTGRFGQEPEPEVRDAMRRAHESLGARLGLAGES